VSEPCKHERLDDLDLCHNADQWRVAWQGALQGHRDAIGSFVAQTQELVEAQHERDAALATIERVRALCDTDLATAVTVGRVLAVLEEPSS